MIHPDVRRDDAAAAVPASPNAPAAVPTAPPTEGTTAPDRAPAPFDLARHQAETERMKVFVEFLSRPVHAHGGGEPDADIVTAYNLAVEAALQYLRRGALGG